MLIVQFGLSLTIVDGFAHDEHGGKGEVVFMDYLRQILQDAAIDFLVGPGKVVTSCDRRVLGVFLQEFVLHIINYGSRKEDAHGTLTSGK